MFEHLNIRSGKLASVSTWWCTWAWSYFEGASKFLHFSRIPTRRGQDADDHGGDHQEDDDDDKDYDVQNDDDEDNDDQDLKPPKLEFFMVAFKPSRC